MQIYPKFAPENFYYFFAQKLTTVTTCFSFLLIKNNESR